MDMSTSNSWAEFAGIFLRTREAAVEHERVAPRLKAVLLPGRLRLASHGHLDDRRGTAGTVFYPRSISGPRRR